MKTKAIAFNYLDDSLESRDIMTDFKTVDEFWYGTSVGPLMKAEVWADTKINRAIIADIIELKLEMKTFKNNITKLIYELNNMREK